MNPLGIPLTRPLVGIDLETTSVDTAQARIVEIAFVEWAPARPGCEVEYSTLINPGRSIPPEAYAVHGISDNDVLTSPRFESLAEYFYSTFTDVDFLGYNVDFDLDVLEHEFARIGMDWSPGNARIIDGLAIWKALYPRTLSDFYKTFVSSAPREGAHEAQSDINDTIFGIRGILNLHSDVPKTLDALHAMRRGSGSLDRKGCLVMRADGKPAWNVGKYKGVAVTDLDEGFVKWVQKSDFSRDTKKLLKALRNG